MKLMIIRLRLMLKIEKQKKTMLQATPVQTAAHHQMMAVLLKVENMNLLSKKKILKKMKN